MWLYVTLSHAAYALWFITKMYNVFTCNCLWLTAQWLVTCKTDFFSLLKVSLFLHLVSGRIQLSLSPSEEGPTRNAVGYLVSLKPRIKIRSITLTGRLTVYLHFSVPQYLLLFCDHFWKEKMVKAVQFWC